MKMLFKDYASAELAMAAQLAYIEQWVATSRERTTVEPPTSVRVTVDLPWPQHQSMRLLCLWYGEQLDIAKVAGAELFRVLLKEVLTDERLAARVGAALTKLRV
jgi:hypothetical protein